MITHKRLALALGGVLLPATMLVAATPAAAAPSKCVYTASSGRCYTFVSSAKSSFKPLHTDGLANYGPRTANLECRVDTSKTYSATTSVSVTASVKAWMVGTVDATVSAEVSRSVTTTIGSTVATPVPAKSLVYCHRGSFLYKGTYRVTGHNGQTAITPYYMTVTAPASLIWKFSAPKPL